MLDKIDKDIIKVLLKYQSTVLTTNQIAKKIERAQLTTKRHLQKLEQEGYVYYKLSEKIRKYKLKNGKTS